nr:unnamed protein product [Digitaria exilis]
MRPHTASNVAALSLLSAASPRRASKFPPSPLESASEWMHMQMLNCPAAHLPASLDSVSARQGLYLNKAARAPDYHFDTARNLSGRSQVDGHGCGSPTHVRISCLPSFASFCVLPSPPGSGAPSARSLSQPHRTNQPSSNRRFGREQVGVPDFYKLPDDIHEILLAHGHLQSQPPEGHDGPVLQRRLVYRPVRALPKEFNIRSRKALLSPLQPLLPRVPREAPTLQLIVFPLLRRLLLVPFSAYVSSARQRHLLTRSGLSSTNLLYFTITEEAWGLFHRVELLHAPWDAEAGESTYPDLNLSCLVEIHPRFPSPRRMRQGARETSGHGGMAVAAAPRGKSTSLHAKSMLNNFGDSDSSLVAVQVDGGQMEGRRKVAFVQKQVGVQRRSMVEGKGYSTTARQRAEDCDGGRGETRLRRGDRG